jgi:hypothetical protein
MPFTLARYAQLRPFLYHLTARANHSRIAELRRLESTAVLLVASRSIDALRVRRRSHLPLRIGAHQVLVRDQAPLHAGNVAFAEGWNLADLVADLNRRVFFWPGGVQGPISYGQRHFARYAVEMPLIIRVRAEALFQSNPERTPLFCRYNSGSPRCNGGRPSPRGPDTFLSAECCQYGPANVVEVTFLDTVMLPPDVECADHPGGSWRPLFAPVW